MQEVTQVRAVDVFDATCIALDVKGAGRLDAFLQMPKPVRIAILKDLTHEEQELEREAAGQAAG